MYDSHDPLIALTAAAAVTDRVQLCTMIVIGPLRGTACWPRQAATLDVLSSGRLVLGLSIGARKDDYEASGPQWRGRGAQPSAQVAELRDVWDDPQIGPAPAREGGPVVLVGRGSGASFQRAARHADGYVHGGGPPRAFASAADKARAAWLESGRSGQPALWGQSYFTLTDAAAGEAYMRDYLPRLVGLGRATEILMLGEKVTAEEAERIGLANRVVDDEALAGEVSGLARRLAEGPTFAYGATKTLLTKEQDMSLPAAIELEAWVQAMLMRSVDHAEFYRAFTEGRDPRWSGR